MATRFYFSSTDTVPNSPGFAAWTRTTEGDRRRMATGKDGSAFGNKSMWANGTAAANDSALARQYASWPIVAGTAFTTSHTVKCVVRCYESGVNDNINRTPLCLKVYNGTTLQATLLSLSAYGPNTTEWNTSLRNKQLADGDVLTSGYTTVAGDYLVAEIGGQVSSAGGSGVTGYQEFGSASGTDLAENETGTSQYCPWLEISLTFYQAEDRTPTTLASTITTYAPVLQISIAGASPSALTTTGYAPTIVDTPPAAVDIGGEAITREDGINGDYTVIDLTNPANATGTVTDVEIYFQGSGSVTGVKVGIFYLVSGTTYKCRSATTLGTVTAGSKQTYSDLSLSCQTGDFIGCYFAASASAWLYYSWDGSPAGSGIYYYGSDTCTVDNSSSYSLLDADAVMSLYGFSSAGGNITCTPTNIASTTTGYAPVDKFGIITDLLTSTTSLQNAVTGYGVVPTTLPNITATFIPVNQFGIIAGLLTSTTSLYAPVNKYGIVVDLGTLTTATYIPVDQFGIIAGLLTSTTSAYIPVNQYGIIPSTLAVATSLQDAIVGYGIVPTTLAVTTSGYIPVLQMVIPVGVLDNVLTQYNPSAIYPNNITATPDLIALTLTAYVPVNQYGIIAGLGTMTTSAYIPVIQYGIIVDVTGITSSLYAPVLDYKIVGASPATLTIGLGNLPVVGYGVVPTTISVTTTGYASRLDEVMPVGLAALSLLGYAPVNQYGIIIPTSALISLGYAPDLTSPFSVIPLTATLSLVLYNPNLGASNMLLDIIRARANRARTFGRIFVIGDVRSDMQSAGHRDLVLTPAPARISLNTENTRQGENDGFVR